MVDGLCASVKRMLRTVADFTGVTGMLEDGKLKLVGGEWPLELRKLPPRPAAE